MSTLTVTSINSAELDAVSANVLKVGVQYDCTTSTIYKSYNVSSITDNTTGNFTFGITNAMADAEYMSGCSMAAARNNNSVSNQAHMAGVTYATATSFRVDNKSDTGNDFDSGLTSTIVFGDVA